MASLIDNRRLRISSLSFAIDEDMKSFFKLSFVEIDENDEVVQRMAKDDRTKWFTHKNMTNLIIF